MHRSRGRGRARSVGVTAVAAGLAGAVALSLPLGPAAGAEDPSAEVAEHLTEATKNSGGDLDLVNTIRTYACDAVEDPGFYDRTGAERKATRVPLTQVFDDLWYVGSQYVGQYFVETAGGGIVLIDSLNNAAEVDEYTVPALEELGVGTDRELEGVLLSHGHGDHDGGAARLRQLYGPDLPIYLGSGDVPGKSYAPTPVDSGIEEPQELELDGTRIIAQAIPGHTPGALNFLVPVDDRGRERLLLMGGRQGHPRGAEAAAGYLAGTERTYELVERFDVDGTFLTHPTSDGSLVKMQAMERNGGRGANPFVIGNDRTKRAAAIWRGCAAAWLAAVDPSADLPVWRVTTLSAPQVDRRTGEVSSRLETGWGSPDTEAGWGVLARRTVEFTVGARTICRAQTNAEGIATCTPARRPGTQQRVTSRFGGATSGGYVDLASSTRAPATR